MSHSMPAAANFSRTALAAGFLLALAAPAAEAQFTWNLPGGGSWNAAASWNPAAVPNAAGASVTFNNAATGSNPAQTGNHTVALDGAQTVGAITFNNDAANAFTNALQVGTGGSLTFDAAGAGPATISVPAAVGTGNNTISAPLTFADTVVATVDQVSASSAAGALNLTGTIGGAGGFTKQGDGLATFGTGAKTYTGATVLNGGRMRISAAAQPSATSSFTVNAGAQLTFLTAGGTITIGGSNSVPLNLNGSGPTTGPFALFPGAIRSETGAPVSITNAVALQSDTLLHVEGATTGSLTLTGGVSGPGHLRLTAPNSGANQGQLVLAGTNSYSGGTTVAGGLLVAGAASVAALGTGGVVVDNATSPSSVARLRIETGAVNVIDDAATLSLAGGGAGGVADQNFADLQAGVAEVVGALALGGVTQAPGTYGATGSGATFVNDEYFTGPGVVIVPVPEPGSVLLAVCGVLVAGGWVGRRLRRSVG